MKRIDFEYAIKKDIRNNPIVREIDQVRQRELGWAAIIGATLVMIVLGLAWQQFSFRSVRADVEKMREEKAVEESIHRQLKLEEASLESPARIERLASDWLDMSAPTASDSVVLQRVVTSPPPERSVVARRGAQ